MNLRHARTFVTVAELGTVSAAALHLRIAQPALSRQIEALERELGLKLFDRVGRRLALTGVGEQMLGECKGLLETADVIGEHARFLQRGEAGVLRIAASPQFIEGVISSFWHRYAKRYPAVQIVLIEAIGWADIERMLERGEVHLGQNLLHAIPTHDRRFGSCELRPVDLLAASHPSLALGKGKSVEINKLEPHPLLLLDTSFVFRRTFDAACRLAGLKPHIKFESRTPHTLLAMAECRHGVAIIPSAMRVHPNLLRIVGINYRGKALREPLAVYWQKRRPLPAYATAFCEMLKSYVGEIFPVTRPN
jgi:DNA-binding transcriptional LysR family regulator